jgi:hypothetical protein
MNIFFLSSSTEEAARQHCDKHCVKMILETAQILTSVQHRYGNTSTTYKPTHVNHPSTKWAGDNDYHYIWLWKLGMSLCAEYTKRYGKVHKTQAIIEGELRHAPKDMPSLGWQAPPQCMPDEYKVEGGTNEAAISAYRNYYRGEKAYMAKWKNTKQPEWMTA